MSLIGKESGMFNRFMGTIMGANSDLFTPNGLFDEVSTLVKDIVRNNDIWVVASDCEEILSLGGERYTVPLDKFDGLTVINFLKGVALLGDAGEKFIEVNIDGSSVPRYVGGVSFRRRIMDGKVVNFVVLSLV